MIHLLDTNALSDVRRGTFPSLNAWMAGQRLSDLAVSVISLMELETGVRRVERRDPTAGAALRTWLEYAVVPSFADRILPVDEPVARRAAELHVPDPMPAMDALIAATALVHGLDLVTRNTRDMARTGVRLLNPWQ